MLIFSEKRLVPTEINMLVLKTADGGYLYIHRALYDQAVILNHIYKDNVVGLIETLTQQKYSRSDVDLFMEMVPSPIKILGPFLLLVHEDLEEFVDMVGAIHVMSGPIDFVNMLEIPPEMRKTPTFSLSIKEEYQLAWDRFMVNAIPYSEDMFLPQANRPMNGVDTSTIEAEEDGALSKVGDDGQEYDSELEALLFGAGDDIFDFDDTEEESDENEESEQVDTTSAPEPVPTPQTVVVNEPEPEPEPEVPQKELNGVDALIGL